MTQVFITDHTPRLGGGRATRVHAVIEALAQAGPLKVAYVRFGGDVPSSRLLGLEHVSFDPIVPSRGVRRAIGYLRARVMGVPPAFARGDSPELRAVGRQLAGATETTRIIADGPVVAAALRPLSRRRPVIYLAHNVESSFRHALGSSHFGSHRALVRFEQSLLREAAECWMASARDVRLARELVPGARLRHVPNAVDVESIVPVSRLPRPRAAILVADFAYEPNRRGLRFVIEEVFPRVWPHAPDATLLLVGRGLGGVRLPDKRIRALGFVEDLGDAYAGAGLALVPLLEGGGSPLKFVEAMAHALPVVATPIAAQGLDVMAGEHFLQAADAEEFAAAIVTLLRDGGAAMAAAGRDLAERAHSVQAVVAAIAA